MLRCRHVRAAAVDQLKVWGERVGVEVVSQGMGADPRRRLTRCKRRSDATRIWSSSIRRLHNKVNLMNELGKIKRVMSKVVPEVPPRFGWLDGSTGQNALEQAKRFTEVTDVTGLVLTKPDGTAKGGAGHQTSQGPRALWAWERRWRTCRISIPWNLSTACFLNP